MVIIRTTFQFLTSLSRLAQLIGSAPSPEAAGCPFAAPMLMEDAAPAATGRSPRQEEKWQKREDALLDTAQVIIDEEGYALFNMDRLVRESDVSKGTVYNHFSSKEDCLAALCCRGMTELQDMFLRARDFDGTPREKALAIHFAYRLHVKLHPALSMALVTARTAAFAAKTSPQRAARMRHNDETLFAIAFQVIQSAVDAGDLSISADLDEFLLTFLTWSTSYGINMLEDTGFDQTMSQLLEDRNIALIGANVLMDGLGMRPLSSEWDYAATWERIGHEIFPNEVKQLQQGRL